MNRAAVQFRASEKANVATVEGAGDGVDDQREREEDGEVSGLVQGCRRSDERSTRKAHHPPFSRPDDWVTLCRLWSGGVTSQTVGNSPDSLQPQATPQPVCGRAWRGFQGTGGCFWLSKTDTCRVGGQGAEVRLRLLFLRPAWTRAHKAEGDDCTR